MRTTRHLTAALLVAAVATTGCSKREEPSRPDPARTDNAAAKPVSTSGVSTAVAPSVAPPATFEDGKSAYAAKKYGDATAIFERYTERQPKNAWGHYMLGLSAWKSGDAVKAEDAFNRALTIDRRHVKSYVNVSRLFMEQQRYDEAVARLTRAGEIDPSSTEVQRLLGHAYRAQGKTDEAMDAYRRAIELDPLDAWSMNDLGAVLLATDRAEEALPLLEKAVELRKNVPAFHNNLGTALEHVGRVRDAAAAYASALAADPRDEEAKQNLARVETAPDRE